MLLLLRLCSFVNIALASLFILGWVSFCGWKFLKTEEIEVSAPNISEQKELPKNPFTTDFTHVDLERGSLKLYYTMPELELPDLKDELQFLGKNDRPDIQESGQYYLSLKSTGEGRLCRKGKQIYLKYQKDHDLTGKGRYYFSSQETPLWIVVDEEISNTLKISLFLQDESGKIVAYPENHQKFVLSKAEGNARPSFDIGGHRVDGMLFFRQKARLAGHDRFLEQHGGSEYAHCSGRERIDFLIDSDRSYSCFIKEGEHLVWKDDAWHNLEDGETAPYPLLHATRIDDKAIQFELWDVEGRNRVALTLVRTPIHEALPDMSQEFKFIGAKTWAQFLVECRGTRMVFRLNDWLLLTEEGWVKISTPEQLDSYVERRLIGALFVLDKWEKRDGKQMLLGHLFNRDRTEVTEIELPAHVGGELPTYKVD